MLVEKHNIRVIAGTINTTKFQVLAVPKNVIHETSEALESLRTIHAIVDDRRFMNSLIMLLQHLKLLDFNPATFHLAFKEVIRPFELPKLRQSLFVQSPILIRQIL
jgi:hypothetical protein